jgi:excisionase family DNA binding protein
MTTTSIELNVSEAAKLLGLCTETVRKYTAQGLLTRLPGHPLRFGRDYIVGLLENPALCRVSEAMALMGARSYSRLRRFEQLGKLTRVFHPAMGYCYARADVEAILGPAAKWSDLLSSKQASKFLQVSSSTLRRWRQEGRVSPVVTTPTNRHLYRKSDLMRIQFAPEEDLLRGAQVREMLGVSRDKLRSLVHQGKIVVIKTLGGRWRFSRANVLAYQDTLDI